MTHSDGTDATSANPEYARLRLGTAPDSWGIWFPDDAKQPHWSVFLDEVAEAGFRTIELGPFGYLPTHPEQLKDELGKRGLSLTAGTVGTATHRGADAFEKSRRDAFEVCELLAAMDVHHLVVLPEMYTDLHTGALNQSADLTAEQWRDLVEGQSQLGRLVREEFDVRLGFHPHVDAHVDTQESIHKFLADTDPETVSLCLDTGHVEYCSGDNREVLHRHPDRISYIHLKQVNPTVAAQARSERIGFYEAVQRGAMVEPPLGAPAMQPLLDDLAALNRDLNLIIEQDMYPAPPGSAKAIAARTRDYFASVGLLPAQAPAADPQSDVAL
jgi:inosose dehydratase